MLRRIVLTAVFQMAILPFLLAQPQGSSQPQNPQGDPDNPVPLEGIEILLIAGAGLGIARLIAQNRIAVLKKA